MKLFALLLLLAIIATPVSAQFNRVGEQNSINLSWTQIDAPNTSNWQGAQLTNMLSIGNFDGIHYNTDLGIGFVKSNSTNANFGRFNTGITVSPVKTWDWQSFGFLPYFRAGVNANSGNFYQQNHSYWGYEIEPGVVARLGQFYGLVGYRYGDSFSNTSFGTRTEAVTTGLGFDITKNLAVEAKYDMNRGSNNLNVLNVGGVYKF